MDKTLTMFLLIRLRILLAVIGRIEPVYNVAQFYCGQFLRNLQNNSLPHPLTDHPGPDGS